LLEDISVKSPLFSNLIEDLRITDLARSNGDGITGTEAGDAKGKEADDKQDEREPGEAADDVGTHTTSRELFDCLR